MMTYDDPRLIANPVPATAIPGRKMPLSRQKTARAHRAIKTKLTIKHKAKWTINTPSNKTFESIDNNLVDPSLIKEAVRNKVHNRFMDILPNPATRVRLSLIKTDPTSDYYNANYIPGASGAPEEFIAAMGCECCAWLNICLN